MGKLKFIFELEENLCLVLIMLDTELGLAKPQLVYFSCGLVLILGAVDTFLIPNSHLHSLLYYLSYNFSEGLSNKENA